MLNREPRTLGRRTPYRSIYAAGSAPRPCNLVRAYMRTNKGVHGTAKSISRHTSFFPRRTPYTTAGCFVNRICGAGTPSKPLHVHRGGRGRLSHDHVWLRTPLLYRASLCTGQSAESLRYTHAATPAPAQVRPPMNILCTLQLRTKMIRRSLNP